MEIRSPGATAGGGSLAVAENDRNTVQVAAKESLVEGICRLTLQDPHGRRLPDWTPGSHIDLLLPNGLTRQYSLCGDRRDARNYQIAVLRERDGRGGSAYVHDRVQVGDLLATGRPRNNFPLVPATDYLFIAGGIGITPLLPMIQAADILGIPWTLLYGGRSRSTMAFLDALAAHGDSVLVRPEDEFGLLDLDAALAGAGEGTKMYCCGPAPLLYAVQERATTWAPGRVRTERFTARSLGAPARTRPFEVRLARSSITVTVGPDRSVLDALLEAGVTVLSSCREGVCGTCETPVLEGLPDHRDSILGDAERTAGDCMFPCVSRSRSDHLVLDL